MRELSPESSDAYVPIPAEVMKILPTFKSCRHASYFVSKSVTRRIRRVVSGPWLKTPRNLTPMMKMADRQARTVK